MCVLFILTLKLTFTALCLCSTESRHCHCWSGRPAPAEERADRLDIGLRLAECAVRRTRRGGGGD